MVTTNGIRTPYGTLDPDMGGMVIRFTFDFSTAPSQDYTGISGDGSARNVHEMQSIFVDNSANAFPVKIGCFGSGHEFQIPAACQAFLPIFCPDNAFGITASVPAAGSFTVPILLSQKPMDFCVWSIGAADILSAAQNTLYGVSKTPMTIGLINIATTVTLIVTSAFQSITLTNRGAGPIYLGGSGVNPGNGYEMASGQTLQFSGPRPTSNIFAVSGSGSNSLYRILW